jgi:putative intracellular protease/amidase
MHCARRWKPKVERGQVDCARCDLLILPGGAWALDHTDDRTGYLGPSHEACNTSAGGKAAHR